MKTFSMTKPDDWHVHLRDGELMAAVLPHTASVFGRAVVMPNIPPDGVLTAKDVEGYRQRLEKAIRHQGYEGSFTPLMTFRITPQTTPAVVKDVNAAGAIAGKLYPDGVTTGSAGGVKDIKALYPVFRAMADCGLVLSVHCEKPGVPILEAEEAFPPLLRQLVADFSSLRIVVEHVTTARMVKFVEEAPSNVAATITAHHLVLVTDDVFFQPHNFCKPVAKSPADRAALRKAATCGNPQFFFGSDSAPHPREKKECPNPAAGVFSAPVVLSVLAQLFANLGAQDRLEGFTSLYGAGFYGLPPNTGKVTIYQQSWTVPAEYDGVVPFLAGQQLPWKVVC